MRRIVSMFSVFLLAFVVAMPVAMAKKGKKDQDELAKVLGEIEWGDSKDVVLKKIEKQMMAEARKDPKLKRDRILLQREMKKIKDRTRTAEKSYTRLQGSNTGYEVSVIADEFSTNNGESFLRVKDRVAQRFYFFIDGKFYKLVVAYNRSYLRNADFEGFVGSSVKKYGRPTEAEYETIEGEEQLALVEWQTPETMLYVKNKKEFFGTFTMSFADRQRIKRLMAQNKRFGGSDKDEEELSAEVQSLTQSNSVDANANVVDSIVGDVNVNFNEGRPKDDQIRRYDKDGNVIESGEAQASAEKKTKKTKKKKKKKKKKKRKKPDFSDLEAKSGDDLIIY
jgi:hypothetical protein